MFTVYADDRVLYSPDMIGCELISASVKEEVGKAGEFTFSIAPDHPFYGRLKPLKTKIHVEQDGETIFRGRILHSERDVYGVKSVYCEGELAYLVDTIQRPFEYTGYPLDLMNMLIENHNEQVESAKRFQIGIMSGFPRIDPDKVTEQVTKYKWVTTGSVTLYASCYKEGSKGTLPANTTISIIGTKEGMAYVSASGVSGWIESGTYRKVSYVEGQENIYFVTVEIAGYETTMDVINSNIIDKFGGFLRVRYDGEARYLDYIGDATEKCSQTIEFGKNLLDLNDAITAESIFTVIIPLGQAQKGTRPTIETVNDGKDYLESQQGIELFGRIVKTVMFEDQTEPAELMQAGEEALQTAILQALTVDVAAIDLHMLGVETDAIRAGKLVRVISETHGIDTELVCSSITYDLLKPENTKYSLGASFSTMTDVQNVQKSKVSNVSSTVSKISGSV